MDLRPATLAELRCIQSCARAAYSMYVLLIGKRLATMDVDCRQQIPEGKVQVLADNKTVVRFAVFCRRVDRFDRVFVRRTV